MSSAHREAAIAAAKQAAAKENGGPVAGLFANAAATMQIAHQMAAASKPGGEEATGVSKSTQLSEAELEDIFYDTYAKLTGIRPAV